MGRVGKPIAALPGYLAAFRIRNVDPAADLVLDSLKHTDTPSRIIAVATKMNARRVWPNNGNRLQGVHVQRQEIVFVLQQSKRPPRGLCRQCLMFTRIRDAHGTFDLGIGRNDS